MLMHNLRVIKLEFIAMETFEVDFRKYVKMFSFCPDAFNAEVPSMGWKFCSFINIKFRIKYFGGKKNNKF